MIDTYILIILVTITYLFINICPIKNRNEKFLIACFFEIFIILILRTPISDMRVYIKTFQNISLMSMTQVMNLDLEKGYVLFNKILSLITTNERIFICITSFIGLLGPYLFIKKYSKNYFLSIVIYIGLNFLVLQYYILRQAMAMTFTLLAINSIKEKKILKFIFLIFIATMFHYSAIIVIVVYLLSNIKIKKTTYTYIYILFICTYMCRGYISALLGSFSDYSIYINSANDTSSGLTMLILLIICNLAIYAIKFYIDENPNEEKDEEENILLIMYILAIFFQILATNTNIIARIVMYFSISLVVLLPNSIEKIQDKYLKSTCIFIVFVLLLGYSYSLNNAFPYIPFYRS